MKFSLSKIAPYLLTITVFMIVSIAYFSPVLEGKKIQQGDITQFKGSSKEIADFRAENNAEPYWTNATFGGMPAYAVSAYYPYDFINKLDNLIRFLPRPAYGARPFFTLRKRAYCLRSICTIGLFFHFTFFYSF